MSDEFFIIDVQWFLGYQYKEVDGDDFNLFQIKRGYLNFQTDLNDKFSARITPDITQDKEGDGKGDIELRLKYLYLKYKFNSNAILSRPVLVFGLNQRPWIDFEQHINPYRVQGRMFAERSRILNSADFGVTFTSLLGGGMSETYQKKVNDKEPGRYGSIALGVYNGGGYHAIEENENKTFETRITLRPLPDFLPGFQVSYTGAYGKGNISASPDFYFNNVFFSMQQEYFTATSQYMWGTGNSSGSYDELPYTGHSFFANAYIPNTKFELFGRYDRFNLGSEGDVSERSSFIGGVAYSIVGKSKLLLDIDHTIMDTAAGLSETTIYEVVLEIKF